MLILAVILMAFGSMGQIAAVVLEVQTGEPVYALLMKVMPWFWGMGAVFFAIHLSKRGKR